MDDDSEGGAEWMDKLRRIRENDPDTTDLSCDEHYFQTLTDEDWEELGRDISNNTNVTNLLLSLGDLNDHKMSFLFRGLTRSSSIQTLDLCGNNLSTVGVRSLVPFLQNATNLTELDLNDNNIQSEGFNLVFRALSDSPVKTLYCSSCGIKSIEIDNNHIPKHLKTLYLNRNSINADGCREIAKLLRVEDSTLTDLYLQNTWIDDEGVEILVHALQNNTALKTLDLFGNRGISKQGATMLLKLVNDISSIKATLQSNHTLTEIALRAYYSEEAHIRELIHMATAINRLPEEAGGKKVIEMQLNSVKRSELEEMQGVNHSLYSEIDPLHLPEVLSLVGRHHGQGDLYIALKSSIAGVISTVSRKECLKQQIAEQRTIMVECQTKIEAAEAEIAAIEAAEAHCVMGAVSDDSRSNKRRRS